MNEFDKNSSSEGSGSKTITVAPFVNFVPNGTPDMFVQELETGETLQVSLFKNGSGFNFLADVNNVDSERRITLSAVIDGISYLGAEQGFGGRQMVGRNAFFPRWREIRSDGTIEEKAKEILVKDPKRITLTLSVSF